MRKPELVHVFVDSTDGPEIVHWQHLMQDADLCNRAFGDRGANQEALQQTAEDMASEAARAMQAFEKVAAAAKLVEAQEHQAWCELPLREVAWALTRNEEETEVGMSAALALMAVCQHTGLAHRAISLGRGLLRVEEAKRLWC